MLRFCDDALEEKRADGVGSRRGKRASRSADSVCCRGVSLGVSLGVSGMGSEANVPSEFHVSLATFDCVIGRVGVSVLGILFS